MFHNCYFKHIKNRLLEIHILTYLESSLICKHDPHFNPYALTDLMILSHEPCVFPFETDKVKQNPNSLAVCEPCYILTALKLATIVKISLQRYISYIIVKITPLGKSFVQDATNIQKVSSRPFRLWHQRYHINPITSLEKPLNKDTIDSIYDYQRYGMPCLTDKLDLVAFPYSKNVTRSMFVRFIINHLDSYASLFDASHPVPLKHLLDDHMFDTSDYSFFECR